MGPSLSSLMSIQDLMASYGSSLSKLHEEPSEKPLQKFSLYHLPLPSLTLPAGSWKYVMAQVKTCVVIVIVLLPMLQGRCYAILVSSCNARLCLDACDWIKYASISPHSNTIFFLFCNKAVFSVHTKPQGQLFLS